MKTTVNMLKNSSGTWVSADDYFSLQRYCEELEKRSAALSELLQISTELTARILNEKENTGGMMDLLAEGEKQ